MRKGREGQEDEARAPGGKGGAPRRRGTRGPHAGAVEQRRGVRGRKRWHGRRLEKKVLASGGPPVSERGRVARVNSAHSDFW